MLNKFQICNYSFVAKYKSAFTLAEVLITLVIIGVIAAITIPAMIQQTQKQEYVVGLKKAYSTLQNALYKMADNNGYPHGDYTFLNNVNFIDEFEKVANIVKKCNKAEDCFASSLSSSSSYKNLNNTQASGWTEGKSVITNDGQMYTYLKGGHGHYGISDEDIELKIGRILVDLNGWKKPNQFGYDMFLFYVLDEKGIIPAGSSSTNDCQKSDRGYSCAAKVLRENKIDY